MVWYYSWWYLNIHFPFTSNLDGDLPSQVLFHCFFFFSLREFFNLSIPDTHGQVFHFGIFFSSCISCRPICILLTLLFKLIIIWLISLHQIPFMPFWGHLIALIYNNFGVREPSLKNVFINLVLEKEAIIIITLI